MYNSTALAVLVVARSERGVHEVGEVCPKCVRSVSEVALGASTGRNGPKARAAPRHRGVAPRPRMQHTSVSASRPSRPSSTHGGLVLLSAAGLPVRPHAPLAWPRVLLAAAVDLFGPPLCWRRFASTLFSARQTLICTVVIWHTRDSSLPANRSFVYFVAKTQKQRLLRGRRCLRVSCCHTGMQAAALPN